MNRNYVKLESDSEENKSILITGCSSGIGRAMAEYLAKRGFIVFATVRKEEDERSLLSLNIDNLIPICPLDLTRLDQVTEAAERVSTELERRGQSGLYAYINNAGGGRVGPVELMDAQKFGVELQTRLAGPVALIQALLPLIRRAGGRIVWIMTPATIPTPYVASIHACDFAANCIARTLEIELKPWAIPVIQIRCGGIKTARGLETTQEVEALLQYPKASLYAESLRKWGKEMAAFDEKRTEPEKVAEVVHKALLARRPRRRYAVGYMSGAATMLESLPQPLVDAVLRNR
jgi:NAD(P)-dependent dehydrogenase (short-subunit alcohol dehydrogenase family)